MNECNHVRFSECTVTIGVGEQKFTLYGDLRYGTAASQADELFRAQLEGAVKNCGRARAWPIEYLADFK